MNKNIPLVIDSSIFKQIPKLNSPLFRQIIKYTRIGIFKIYISAIVEKEYLTWIEKEAQEAFNKVVKSSESLNKFYDEPKICGFSFDYNPTASIAKNHINGILKKVLSNWNDFKTQTNAIILPINDSHGRLVMNAYFDGSAPFKEKKNRSDIPDAFIYYSILDLLQDNENVIFVSQDKEFRKKINNAKISTFDSLSDLFLCNDYKIADNFFTEIKRDDKIYFLFQYFKDEIIKKTKWQIELSDLIDDIEHEHLDNIIGKYKSVSSNVDSIQFNYTSIQNISSESYLISFTAIVNQTIFSEATKNDLDSFHNERIKNLKDKDINDDGYYDISEIFESKVSGNASISFADTNPLSWEEKEINDGIFKESELTEINVSIENIEKSA